MSLDFVITDFLKYIYYILFFTLDHASTFLGTYVRILRTASYASADSNSNRVNISAKGMSYHGRSAGENVKIIKVRRSVQQVTKKIMIKSSGVSVFKDGT